MNYFDSAWAAKRYSLARPYFHPMVIDMVRKQLGLTKVATALDVACGTGQSTLALLAVADTVTGTDLSHEMLDAAATNAAVTFLLAPAEQQPFPDSSFNLITVCMAYHWFNQPAFLAEAKRLLTTDGALVIYNSYFPGIMANNESFMHEMRHYYSGFPSPKRKAQQPDQDAAAIAGFTGRKLEFEFWEEWALPQLIGYLTTQSNVIDRVDSFGESIDRIEVDIAQQFRGYFSEPTEHFLFKGDVSILKIER